METKCQVCGKPLTDPVSREIGYGPICEKRLMGVSRQSTTCERGLFDDVNDIFLSRNERGMPLTNVRHVWKYRSPDGFGWGDGGPGPSDLALNILLRFIDNHELAWDLHQDFKREFIATMPLEGGVIRESEIRDFIERKADERGHARD